MVFDSITIISIIVEVELILSADLINYVIIHW